MRTLLSPRSLFSGKELDRSGLNFLTSSHERHSECGVVDLLDKQLSYGYTLREDIHSHPSNTPVPSNRGGNNGDINHSVEVINHFGNVTFKIYIPKYDKYIEYQPNYNKLPELLVTPAK